MALLIEEAEQLDHIALHTGTLSEEEFWALCARYPAYEIEVSAEGEAIIMAPVSGWTGTRNSSITAQLEIWAEKDGLGFAFDSSTIFLLPNGARRSPDGCWVSEKRVPKQNRWSWNLCPEFIIELRSESDRGVNLRKKMQEWMDNGAQLAWLIEPKTRTVVIYRPGREPETLVGAESIFGEGPVEGFELNLGKIWRVGG